MNLIQLHRDHKGSLRWLEPALERVHRMSRRFDGDADALVNQVWKLLAEKSAALGFWVGVEDEQIVGHVLAIVQPFDGRWVLWVTQAESDVRITRAFHDLVLGTLEDFAETFNFSFAAQGITLDRMLMTTPRSEVAWMKHSGWQPYRSIMSRSLPLGAKKGAS